VQKHFLAYSAAAVALSVVVWGCSNKSSSPTATNNTATKSHSEHDHAHHHKEGEAVNSSTNAEVAASFAKLSAEDRAIAEKQKICPVSGEELGSMGAPIKVDVKGQPVFICCEGCKEELLAKPDEYLAKLQK